MGHARKSCFPRNAQIFTYSYCQGNIFGKIKTVTQLVAIIAALLMQFLIELFTVTSAFSVDTILYLQGIFTVVSLCLIWISTIMALVSGVIYIVQNKQFIADM